MALVLPTPSRAQRKHRIIHPGRSPLYSGAGADVAPLEQAWPLISNFEDANVGDNVTVLDASWRHNSVFSAGATVQLDDYGALPAFNADLFINCVTDDTTAVGESCQVAADDGFTPSDNQVLVVEGIFFSAGINLQTELYILSADGQDGIHAYLVGNGNAYLRTATGGSWTAKYGPIGTTTNPFEQWHAFMLQYDFSADRIYFRVVELGAGVEDSGWVGGGTITPTFAAGTELVTFQPTARSDSVTDMGFAQLYVADFAVGGYNDAAAGVHNYVDLIP